MANNNKLENMRMHNEEEHKDFIEAIKLQYHYLYGNTKRLNTNLMIFMAVTSLELAAIVIAIVKLR